jgi:hypothetical protein
MRRRFPSLDAVGSEGGEVMTREAALKGIPPASQEEADEQAKYICEWVSTLSPKEQEDFYDLLYGYTGPPDRTLTAGKIADGFSVAVRLFRRGVRSVTA